jgi:hypothetical protein
MRLDFHACRFAALIAAGVTDPPCPWGANAWRESLPIVLTWAGDSEITSPCEERTSRFSIFFLSTFNVGRSMFSVPPPPKEWWTPIRHVHEKPMDEGGGGKTE